MDYPTFVAAVRERGGYADRESIEGMMRIVLGLLGRRLGKADAADLTVHLPAEVRQALVGWARETASGWDVSEFVCHLAQATGTTEPEAAIDATAVLGAVADTIGDEGLDAFLSRLPAGYAGLLGRGEPA